MMRTKSPTVADTSRDEDTGPSASNTVAPMPRPDQALLRDEDAGPSASNTVAPMPRPDLALLPPSTADAEPFEPFIRPLPLGVISPMPGLGTDTIPTIADLTVWSENLELQCPPNEGNSDDEEAFSRAFAVEKRFEVVTAKATKKATSLRTGPSASRKAAPSTTRSMSASRNTRIVADDEGVDGARIVADDEDDTHLPGAGWLVMDQGDSATEGDNGGVIDENQEYDVLKLPTNIVRRDMLLYIVGPYEADLEARIQFKVCFLTVISHTSC
jgi:hypothetical protein